MGDFINAYTEYQKEIIIFLWLLWQIYSGQPRLVSMGPYIIKISQSFSQLASQSASRLNLQSVAIIKPQMAENISGKLI